MLYLRGKGSLNKLLASIYAEREIEMQKVKNFFVVEWKERPWGITMFFVPMIFVLMYSLGLLTGWQAALSYGASFGLIGIVRASLPIFYRLKNGEWKKWHVYDYDYENSVRSCSNARYGMIIGSVPALFLFSIIWLNSPEMKAADARNESLRQAAILSGTLKFEGDVPRYREGTVMNPPELVGNGKLMVVRVEIEGDVWSPRMMFFDPTQCKGLVIPSIGDRVRVRVQTFRARQENWHAEPGHYMATEVPFVELECE